MDIAGNYKLDIGTSNLPTVIEVSGGTYTDVASGGATALTTPLRSIQLVPTGNDKVAVTTLTEIAYRIASKSTGGLTAANINAAVANVQANFGVADIVHTIPTDPLKVGNDATSDQKAYALALAIVSHYQKMQPAGTSLTSVIDTLSACLINNASCGSGGTNSVGVALNAAAAAFQQMPTNAALADLHLPVAAFGKVPLGAGKYRTVTILGLNARTNGGSLRIASGSDLLDISSDGTYVFSTPLTDVARIDKVLIQPSGQVCSLTSARQDQVDPYTNRLITPKVADYFCYDAPCGSLVSLGAAPAPQGLVATATSATSITLNFKSDIWGFNYHVYYGLKPVPVTVSTVGNAESEMFTTSLFAPTVIQNLQPNKTYYFAISSIYSNPANLAVCQSKASMIASATTTTSLSLSPSSGATGTTVSITGQNFSTVASNNVVKFNGVQATVLSASATLLTVAVPTGATTGSVTVSSPLLATSTVGSFAVIAGTTLSLQQWRETWWDCAETYVAFAGATVHVDNYTNVQGEGTGEWSGYDVPYSKASMDAGKTTFTSRLNYTYSGCGACTIGSPLQYGSTNPDNGGSNTSVCKRVR